MTRSARIVLPGLAHPVTRRCFGIAVQAYCPMPNHLHLILMPSEAAGLGLALARARQTGHLFQDRFGSVARDKAHLLDVVRYVALNPVRARLVARAQCFQLAT